jgi:mannose-1-phosphate guanylyltransferase
MAGGTGTRLWPMSRKSKPKQFQNLVSDKSLLQETYDRVRKALKPEQIYISTNSKYEDEIKKQLTEIPSSNYIIEPAKRNTGPALALIAQTILRTDKDAIIATIASDHTVQNVDVFANTLNATFKAIEKYPNYLGTVGINPDHPDTGLGYIKMAAQLDELDGEAVFKVNKFVEKPDMATAKKYVQRWEYLWNAGYFFFRADSMLGWIKKYRPKTYKLLKEYEKVETGGGNGSKKSKLKEIFEKIEDEPIEPAIIEQKDFKNVLVIPADLGWSDVGSWGTLYDILSSQFGSKIISRGHHIDYGSSSTMVYAHDKMIATIGLDNIIVIDTPTAILVANKEKSQDVKKLLDKLEAEGRHLYL